MPGVGPFTAEAVYLRGCGVADEIPETEELSLQAAADLYDKPGLDRDGYMEIAEKWRPYRMWAVVLLRVGWNRERGARYSRIDGTVVTIVEAHIGTPCLVENRHDDLARFDGGQCLLVSLGSNGHQIGDRAGEQKNRDDHDRERESRRLGRSLAAHACQRGLGLRAGQ